MQTDTQVSTEPLLSPVCIRGVGCYVPTGRITNQEVATRLGVTDEYIVKLTGIRERRQAAPEQATSDMAVQAAQAALADAGMAPEEVDCLLVATATADHLTPSTANLVQQRLGLRPIPAYDLNAGCTGALYSFITAVGLIRSRICRTVLVVGAELISRIVDVHDPETALVFGDGAGALVVQAGPGKPGICSSCRTPGPVMGQKPTSSWFQPVGHGNQPMPRRWKNVSILYACMAAVCFALPCAPCPPWYRTFYSKQGARWQTCNS